jgi:hypothetical protein
LDESLNQGSISSSKAAPWLIAWRTIGSFAKVVEMKSTVATAD